MAMTSGEPVDGRTARALRTRESIVDACIALVERGDVRPTAPRIADEAGVSVRSVFQHFDDLDTLHTAVAARTVERVAFLLLPIDPGLDLPTRVETLVRQRSQLHEAITPIRRAAAVHEPSSSAIGQWLNDGHAFLRDEIERTFEPELDAHGDRRPQVLDAVDTMLSWSAWESLRARTGRPVDEAAEVLIAAVTVLLVADR